MKIALIGNQNSGKTTLFNRLTGSSAHVGNFPGVTVDSKMASIKGHEKLTLIDLPGIYSLSPYSNEEIVTRDCLINDGIDLIINIVDATNLERNLYLTLQLLELNKPMIIALNMMDEVKGAGNSINVPILENELEARIMPISASKNEGIEALIDLIKEMSNEKNKTIEYRDICEGAVHRAIHSMMMLIEDHAESASLPLRFAATRIVEGDKIILDKLNLSDNEKDIVAHVINEMETETKLDNEAALADMRYAFIDKITARSLTRVSIKTKEQARSLKIDKILTNKYLAFPIFILIMALIFYLTFGLIGYYASVGLDYLFTMFSDFCSRNLLEYGLNPVVHSLLIDGIFAGVFSVLSFLPTIILLFFFLSILEDSGYMARVAFIIDKPLRHLGLSGRSFVPLLLGFGCTVPAVMATRTLTSKRDQRLTIMLTPFMSCSAKLPVYAMITAAFFKQTSAFVMIGIYLLGIVMAILVAFITKYMVKGKPVPFMMELPAYRLPTPKNTFVLIKEKAKSFIIKAFTIIFVASVVIWFLRSFDYKLNYLPIEEIENSILASLSKFVAPIFIPLGFGSWEVTAALLTGLTAKEAVVSTLTILLPLGDISAVLTSSLAAFSLLTFILLYMPCLASFAVIKKELHSTLEAVLMMVFQTSFAWLVSCLIYNSFSFLL